MGTADETTARMAAPLLERRCQLTPGKTMLSQKWGVLHLYPDHLQFTADNERSSFTAPFTSLHSPRNWVGRGITIYQDDKRLKFDFTYQDPLEQADAAVRADDPVLLAAQGRTEDRLADFSATEAARIWTESLARCVTAAPPPGVRVKKTFGPEQRTLYIALVLALLGLIVAIAGILIYVVLLVLKS